MSKSFENSNENQNEITAYSHFEECLKDNFKSIEALLDLYLLCKKNGNFIDKKELALGNFKKSESVIDFKTERIEKNVLIAVAQIKKIYHLDSLEWFCLRCSLMIRADKRYSEKFKRMDNQEQDKIAVSCETFLKLYYFAENIFEIDGFYNKILKLQNKLNTLCFVPGTAEIDDRLFQNIMSNMAGGSYAVGTHLRLPLKGGVSLIIRESLAQDICDFLNRSEKDKAVYFYIHGEKGIGKTSIVHRVCDEMKQGLMCIDVKKILENVKDINEILISAFREAFILSAYICFCNFEEFSKSSVITQNQITEFLTQSSRFAKGVFVLSNEDVQIRENLKDFCCVDLPVEKLTFEESFDFWNHQLKTIKIDKDVSSREMANKFTFTPAQIANTVRDAYSEILWSGGNPINKQALCLCAYKQVTSNLADKATLIKKKHTWDELVMEKEQKEIIKRACDQIRFKHIVYDKWGMKKRVLYGRGLSMLFTGPPGTGKTMAAQVVAHELSLEIYKVDLSKVVSKYIGESEKNLGEVFDSAKKSNVILLFDETDALFGKRTEVKDSHDKNANLETSYLLQKMEEYDGITIMTTNFAENIDKAFFRRISYVVHFDFPAVPARKEIWQKMYPKETPLDRDVDFDYLANQFEIAGGSIKNVAVTSSFMAASETQKVGMKHIVKALEYEIKKQGKMASRDEFGEYGYLL